MSKRGGALAPTLPRILLALLAMPLALAASAGAPHAAAEPVDAMPTITLVEQRVIRIADSQLLSLSPDGGSIVVTRPAGPMPTELCIHEVATLAVRICADVSDLDAGLWPDSVVWSPDSAWLAFAELWPMFLVDGDLWLMDASTGALGNLLDDGFSGALGEAAAGELTWKGVITLPMYPTFTPDSAAVTFSRTTVQAGEFSGVGDIATLPITGGDAVTLGGSEREELVGEYRTMQWAADGSALYVSLVDQQASRLGPDSGIWVFEADGRHARQLLSITGRDDWPTRILAVSPRGERLLVSDPRAAAGGAPLCACSVVDGSTGAAEPIEPLGSEARQSTPITGAMLSPDGSLVITVSGHLEKQVAVREVATSNETVLLREPSGTAPSDLAGEVLTWAQDDTVLVDGARRGRGTLIVLDRGS